jgi:hypothetical protein
MPRKTNDASAHGKPTNERVAFMTKRWSAIGVIGFWVVACGAERFNDVGELNADGSGGKGGGTGSGASSGSGAGASTGAGAAGGGAGKGGQGNGGTVGKPGPGPEPDGGTAGMGGDGEPPIVIGEGGAGPVPDLGDGPCDTGLGCVFQEGTSIRALAADSTHLYWVEHGTFDELDNYKNDGRLLARAFDSEEVTVIASDLAGPAEVAVTSSHFYLNLDQYWNGENLSAIVRLPRDGSELEIVYLDDTFDSLAAAEGTAYFLAGGSVYSMASDDLEPNLLVDSGADSAISVAGAHLYFTSRQGTTSELLRLPLAGGEPETVTANSFRYVQVSGDHAYALENAWPNQYLNRMPVAGGPWTRLAPGRAAYKGKRIQLVGGLFFNELLTDDYPIQIIQGELSDAANSASVLSLPTWKYLEDWVGTEHALYWSEGSRIRQRLNDVP